MNVLDRKQNHTMVKIKPISRSETACTRDSKLDVRKMHKNVDPAEHPFERAKEVKRAVNAVKLDKMFAKPFLWSLEGHMDGVYSTANTPANLSAFLSGSCDGELRVWDIANKKTLWDVYGHQGFVTGLSVDGQGRTFVSCGDDKTVKQWPLVTDTSSVRQEEAAETDGDGNNDTQTDGRLGAMKEPTPLAVWSKKTQLLSIDHHRYEPLFATAGTDGTVDVWDTSRSEPYQTFTWGADTVNCVRFNPAEKNIFASAGNDRTICLYDTRTSTPLRKVVLAMNSNALDWNPREPFNFTVANEDHNAYTFDMRKLDHALMVHKDHVSAVMDIRYSPTGREFATGSYDRTVRMFRVTDGRSREVYHTKRMQRVFCVNFSADGRYILSGSDDTNIRVWKAQAAKPMKRLLPRERSKLDYYDSLKKRYANVPEVRRIAKHQHVPRNIVKAKKRKAEEENKEKRKLRNINLHSKEEQKPEPERKRPVVQERK